MSRHIAVALVRSGASADLPNATLSNEVGQMSKIPLRHAVAQALAAFFVVGSLSNIFAPGSIYEEYLRWGYPRWFHFVTGVLELTTAVLLARPSTRLLGSALGCILMLGALATVALHGEYGRAAPPLVAAALTVIVGWITWRTPLQARPARRPRQPQSASASHASPTLKETAR